MFLPFLCNRYISEIGWKWTQAFMLSYANYQATFILVQVTIEYTEEQSKHSVLPESWALPK